MTTVPFDTLPLVNADSHELRTSGQGTVSLFPPAPHAHVFDALPPKPTFGFDAWKVVFGEIARAEGNEVSFVCQWDTTAKQITAARVMARGNRALVPLIFADARPGEMILHNHPGEGMTFPSDTDITCVCSDAHRGVGYAICDNAASRLYVVREPEIPATLAPPPSRPARSWRIGRLIIALTSEP